MGAGGEVSEAFCRDLAAYLGRKKAVAVSSGTTALEIALRTIGVEGGRVAIPAYACPSIHRAVTRAGASPLLVDVDEDDLSLPSAFLDSTSADCRAIVVVHQFGLPASCARYASNLSAAVIEDLTTALGAKLGQDPVGRVGRLVILSMAATKLICSGVGGALAGDSVDLNEARRWIDPESSLPDEAPVPNAQLSEMSCAMGLAQLRKLPSFLARRSAIAAHYDHVLQGRAQRVLRPREGDQGTWWRYLVNVSPLDPAAVIEQANERGVGFARPVVARRWASHGAFPVADRLHGCLVSIPIHPSLTDAEVETVAGTTADLLS